MVSPPELCDSVRDTCKETHWRSGAVQAARDTAAGAPADYIAVQKMIHRVVRLNVSALPNRSIRHLTGRPAGTLQQFVCDYADVWR